jgi:c(7)-type cytochrome triheme protein
MNSIIRLVCISAVTTVLVLICARALTGAETAPDKLVFESKMGTVTFDHAKHVEREKTECTNCHDKLFPQSKAPLNFKAGMHKQAEAKKESCAGCHHEGGSAFATKGNCKSCHVK